MGFMPRNGAPALMQKALAMLRVSSGALPMTMRVGPPQSAKASRESTETVRDPITPDRDPRSKDHRA